MNWNNQEIKDRLFEQISSIGKESALLPFANVEIDRTIEELENSSAVAKALEVNQRDILLGEWELMYASNGTVVTRPLAEITNVFSQGIKVNKIWQSLTAKGNVIEVSNQALIELSLLGQIEIGARGIWQPESDWQTARVTFDAFSTQAKQLFGRSDFTLPKLEIPVLEALQNSALWITSYVDEDTRIGKGATGNLFVFRRFE